MISYLTEFILCSQLQLSDLQSYHICLQNLMKALKWLLALYYVLTLISVSKSINTLLCKSMGWLLCDRDLSHERVKSSKQVSMVPTLHKNEVFQFPADLVTFAEEILNGKVHFLCSLKNYFNVDSCVFTIISW